MAENDHFYSVPYPDFFIHRQDMHWPAYKFKMSMDELFTTLPKRFNTMTYPLLDSDAFFQDVSSASHTARNKEEFFQLLQERRDLREKELKELLLRSFSQIAGRPRLMGDDENVWLNAMFIHRYESFDAVVRFFAYFVPPEKAKPLPATSLPPSLEQFSSPTSTTHPSSPTKLDSPLAIYPADSQNEQERTASMPRDLRNHSIARQAADSGNRVQKSNKEGPRRSMRLRMRSQCSPASISGPRSARASGPLQPRRKTAVLRGSGRRTTKK